MARRLIACLIPALILIFSCLVIAQGPPPPPMPPGGPPLPPPPPEYGESNQTMPQMPDQSQMGSNSSSDGQGQGQQDSQDAQYPQQGQQQGQQSQQQQGQRSQQQQRQTPRQQRSPGSNPPIPGQRSTAGASSPAPMPKADDIALPKEDLAEIVPGGPSRNWPVFRGDSSHTGATSEQLGFPLKLAWKFITDVSPNNPSSPSVVDGVVYLCSGSRLYAVNAETGSLKWRYPAEEYLTSAIKSSPLVGDDLVYFGAGDGKLYAITKDTGNLAWSFATKGIMNSSPILVDGIIYVGSSDDHLYALDALTGQEKWPGGFRTKDDVASSPAYQDGLVYFLSNDMMLYAAHTASGRVKWQIRVGNWSTASTPVVSENNVYLATGNSLQTFQAKSGRMKWQVKFASDVSTVPAVGNGMAYLGCRNGKFYGVTSAGKLKWSADLGSAAYGSPIIAGDTVIVGVNRGTLSAFDADTGALKWKYFVHPSALEYGKMRYVNLASSPVVSNGTLYVLADDGALHAFRHDASDSTPPNITPLTPPRDYLMPGSLPIEFAAQVIDGGSGLQEATLTFTVDGQPVEHEFIPERGIVWYKMGAHKEVAKASDASVTDRPLTDGQHTAAVSVYDWAGNKNEVSWYFTVNNKIRKAPKPAPQQQNSQTQVPH